MSDTATHELRAEFGGLLIAGKHVLKRVDKHLFKRVSAELGDGMKAAELELAQKVQKCRHLAAMAEPIVVDEEADRVLVARLRVREMHAKRKARLTRGPVNADLVFVSCAAELCAKLVYEREQDGGAALDESPFERGARVSFGSGDTSRSVAGG